MVMKRKYKFLRNPETGKLKRVFEGDIPPWEKDAGIPLTEEDQVTLPEPTEGEERTIEGPAVVTAPATETITHKYRPPMPVNENPPPTQVHCYYHNDLDGRAAGAIVALAMPWAIMHEVDYNYDPNLLYQTPPNSMLVFVDFTPKIEHLSEIARKGSREFIWIDHHASNVDLVQAEGFAKVPGLRTSDHCGAYLAWVFFYPQLPMPHVLDLIDRWDTWTHNNDPEVLAFKAGVEAYDQSVTSQLWKDLLASESSSDVGRKICQDGNVVMEAKKRYWADCLDKYGFACRFRHQRYSRFKCLALNVPDAPSLAFADADADLYLQLLFDGAQWRVTIYSTNANIKCDEIARHYGGGGLPGASGFYTDELHMLTTDAWDGVSSPAATAPVGAAMGG